MSRRLACSLFSLVAVAACGDDGGNAKVDSGVIDTRMIDTPPIDCDYTEQSDISNDTTSGGVAEATSLAFTTRTVVCGAIDHTHFDGDVTIDGDAFTLTVAAETNVVVRMVAPGAAALELMGIDVRDASDALLGTFSFYGNHGVVSARLPAGTFTLLVLSLGSEAILSSVPYRIEVVTDTPDTRCAEITVGGFMETGDTGSSTGNDVYAYGGTQLPIASFTASGADMPENTAIVLAPGTDIRFYGQSADVTADYYEDTDTYEIATGANTNELSVRLTWTTTGTDLDWYLYEQNTTSAVAAGNTAEITSPEMKLVSVKPNTTYWLAVNLRTGTTVPAAYNATLCGAQYTP